MREYYTAGPSVLSAVEHNSDNCGGLQRQLPKSASRMLTKSIDRLCCQSRPNYYKFVMDINLTPTH